MHIYCLIFAVTRLNPIRRFTQYVRTTLSCHILFALDNIHFALVITTRQRSYRKPLRLYAARRVGPRVPSPFFVLLGRLPRDIVSRATSSPFRL